MYVIFFMILGFVISWVIFLVLLRSNLGVVTVGRNCSQDKKMMAVLFRVGRVCTEGKARPAARVCREEKACTRGALPALFPFLEQ